MFAMLCKLHILRKPCRQLLRCKCCRQSERGLFCMSVGTVTHNKKFFVGLVLTGSEWRVIMSPRRGQENYNLWCMPFFEAF